MITITILYRKIIFLAIILLVISSLPFVKTPTAFACSCVKPGDPREELEKSTAVFSGKVLDVNRDSVGYAYKVSFDVEKIWKGVSRKTVVISTGLGGGDCGFEFTEGEIYIVYAYGNDVEFLSTGICSRTHLLTSADTDISILGKGESPASETSQTDKSASIPFSSATILGIIIGLILVFIFYKIISSRRKSL